MCWSSERLARVQGNQNTVESLTRRTHEVGDRIAQEKRAGHLPLHGVAPMKVLPCAQQQTP